MENRKEISIFVIFIFTILTIMLFTMIFNEPFNNYFSKYLLRCSIFTIMLSIIVILIGMSITSCELKDFIIKYSIVLFFIGTTSLGISFIPNFFNIISKFNYN